MPEKITVTRPAMGVYGGRNVVIGIWPEDLLLATGNSGELSIVGDIETIESLGSDWLVHLRFDAHVVRRDPDTIGEEDSAVDCRR